MRKVIIDTDIEYDMIPAILFLLKCHDLQIVGITLTPGKLPGCLQREIMYRILVSINHQSIPIFDSYASVFEGSVDIEAEGRTTHLLKKLLPTICHIPITSMYSHEAIIDLAQKFPGEINILCLSSLTNLSQAFECNGEIFYFLVSIFVLGGNRLPSEMEENRTLPEINADLNKKAFSYILSEVCNDSTLLVVFDGEVCKRCIIQENLYLQILDEKTTFDRYDLLLLHLMQVGIITTEKHSAFAVCLAIGFYKMELLDQLESAILSNSDSSTDVDDHGLLKIAENGKFKLVKQIDAQKFRQLLFEVLLAGPNV